jgi:phosphonate transport system substrate-binding protein
MRYVMTVSPDFSPDKIAGWYIFNTWLQRQLDIHIHLELYSDFTSQREAFNRGEIDLIYANPFDAAALVREQGFQAVAVPRGKSDEAVIAVLADSPFQKVEDLPEQLHIAATSDPDVNLIAMIMLEPANLNATNTNIVQVDSYILVAKQLLQGKVQAGFFLEESYNGLSKIIKAQLRPLVNSQIHVIQHVFLVGPRLLQMRDDLIQVFHLMNDSPKGHGVLQSLGFQGWEIQNQEDTEFMIDLMDTLVG